MNKSVYGENISIAGRHFEFGIGTRSNSGIEYNVEGLYKKFSAVVGIDGSERNDKGNVEFFVYGNGKELWHSGPVTRESGAIPISVNIEGIGHLLLKVANANNETGSIQADWADAKVEGLLK